ncbi:hypothetical protein D1872_262280 [compost metagenome]
MQMRPCKLLQILVNIRLVLIRLQQLLHPFVGTSHFHILDIYTLTEIPIFACSNHETIRFINALILRQLYGSRQCQVEKSLHILVKMRNQPQYQMLDICRMNGAHVFFACLLQL